MIKWIRTSRLTITLWQVLRPVPEAHPGACSHTRRRPGRRSRLVQGMPLFLLFSLPVCFSFFFSLSLLFYSPSLSALNNCVTPSRSKGSEPHPARISGGNATNHCCRLIRKDAGLCCGSRLRKGEVFAYGGRIHNLQDLKSCLLRSRELLTETKVESGTSQSKSGTSVNFR